MRHGHMLIHDNSQPHSRAGAQSSCSSGAPIATGSVRKCTRESGAAQLKLRSTPSHIFDTAERPRGGDGELAIHDGVTAQRSADPTGPLQPRSQTSLQEHCELRCSAVSAQVVGGGWTSHTDEGACDKVEDGVATGARVRAAVGADVGADDDATEGAAVGVAGGEAVGPADKEEVGEAVGTDDGVGDPTSSLRRIESTPLRWQSVQSVPRAQSTNREFGPPSSQSPSSAFAQVSVQPTDTVTAGGADGSGVEGGGGAAGGLASMSASSRLTTRT